MSELITMARMLRPHLGSRLISAPLTFGVNCHTLYDEERTIPVKSTFAHRPLPSSRSARMPTRAYNRSTATLIPRSWLQERCCERRGYVTGGGRLLSVLSRWRDLQKPGSIEFLSALLGRGADLSLGCGASYRSTVRWRRAGLPITERHLV